MLELYKQKMEEADRLERAEEEYATDEVHASMVPIWDQLTAEEKSEARKFVYVLRERNKN